jgi:general L-amino acid transport system substrate-binding protein
MIRRTRLRTLASLGIVLVLGAMTACSDDDEGANGGGGDGDNGGSGGGGSVLDEVLERDALNCGVNNAVPGFGFQTEEGSYEGFDIDYCKAVAAAVLGDPEKVEYVALTPEQRLPALESGEVDVLIRNTTWVSTRDGAGRAAFVTPTFYDGQAVMVSADSGITNLDGLRDKTVCFTAGTTTEQNLADRLAGIPHTPSVFEANPQVQEAYLAGQCDAWTSDQSQLAGIRSNWPADSGGPESLVVLDEVFSKEPLAPAVKDGDSQWYDIVNWVVLATIQAEEFGITSENVEEMTGSDDVSILRFLGQPVEGEEGVAPVEHGFGIDPDYTVDVITAVGNYGEIYDRNVGPDSALGIDREGTPNALWTDGGLHYSPPFR